MHFKYRHRVILQRTFAKIQHVNFNPKAPIKVRRRVPSFLGHYLLVWRRLRAQLSISIPYYIHRQVPQSFHDIDPYFSIFPCDKLPSNAILIAKAFLVGKLLNPRAACDVQRRSLLFPRIFWIWQPLLSHDIFFDVCFCHLSKCN